MWIALNHILSVERGDEQKVYIYFYTMNRRKLKF